MITLDQLARAYDKNALAFRKLMLTTSTSKASSYAQLAEVADVMAASLREVEQEDKWNIRKKRQND